ncbi:MAG: alpha/beta fold hydrolase [Corynebacterium sp.]|nr:alpha/beta fold hydrolase [Corynebacterium sp.]
MSETPAFGGTHRTIESRHFGLDIREHFLTVPWNWDQPMETFELYARELIPQGGEELPLLVYFQGGPGCEAPRPLEVSGIISEMLRSYRVLLLDQRGTGRSHRIDSASPASDRGYERLIQLRQENIIHDAEALRQALGERQVAVFGQSYGGFLIMTYLTLYPAAISKAYMTGGMPGLSHSIDEVYTSTYQHLAIRHQRWFQEYPEAQEKLRELCDHLENHTEFLPNGQQLTSRLFRTLGIQLGREFGPHQLSYLLEAPFHQLRGEKRLTANFLASVGAQVETQRNPLYSVIHESIYGGIGGQTTTAWAAERLRERIPGFAATPEKDEPLYLTGEHIFSWQFEEDPALQPFAQAATQLAYHQWNSSPYNVEILREVEVPIAATMYVDDIFVPFEISQASAAQLADVRAYMTNQWQHDGIGHAGKDIFARMHQLLTSY